MIVQELSLAFSGFLDIAFTSVVPVSRQWRLSDKPHFGSHHIAPSSLINQQLDHSIVLLIAIIILQVNEIHTVAVPGL